MRLRTGLFIRDDLPKLENIVVSNSNKVSEPIQKSGKVHDIEPSMSNSGAISSLYNLLPWSDFPETFAFVDVRCQGPDRGIT